MCYAKACAAMGFLLVELALEVGALPAAEKVRTSANSRLRWRIALTMSRFPTL